MVSEPAPTCSGLGGMAERALVHGSELRDRSPVPREGVTPLGNCRACRAGSRVENPAGESHLHALPYQRATRHGSADDRLVPIDRVLDHGAPAVACSLGPLAAAEFVDRARSGSESSFNAADGLGLSWALRPGGMHTRTARPSPWREPPRTRSVSYALSAETEATRWSI